MGTQSDHNRLLKEIESLKKRIQELQSTVKVQEASLTMLSASESKYRELVENAIDAIFIVDSDLRYIEANHRATELFGYSHEEYLDMSILDVIPPEQVPQSEKEFQKLQERGAYEHFEGRMRTKDGRWVDIEVSSSAMYDKQGKVIGSCDIVRDITERKKMESQLKQALADKELLLKEMNHRVKNNLQIISSLLSLQSCQMEDKQAAEQLQEAENRVRSMSMIHEKLYRADDLRNIPFSEYITSLTGELFSSYNVVPSIKLDLQVTETTLDVDFVIPCGIIVNELVTNALKHAFPDGTGTVTVSFSKDDKGECTLSVSDDGVALSHEWPIYMTANNSFGMRLVKASAEKLNAHMSMDTNGGKSFVFVFTENTARASFS